MYFEAKPAPQMRRTIPQHLRKLQRWLMFRGGRMNWKQTASSGSSAQSQNQTDSIFRSGRSRRMMQSIAAVRALQAASRTRLRAWQDERLRALLRELATNQFYMRKFETTGLPMTAVTNAEGLARLPFTTKNEL